MIVHVLSERNKCLQNTHPLLTRPPLCVCSSPLVFHLLEWNTSNNDNNNNDTIACVPSSSSNNNNIYCVLLCSIFWSTRSELECGWSAIVVIIITMVITVIIVILVILVKEALDTLIVIITSERDQWRQH